MIEALIDNNTKHWTKDSSVENNNLISREYKYRAYHTSRRNKVLLLAAGTQIIQTLDCGESTDMNHGISKLLFVMKLRRHWQNILSKFSMGQRTPWPAIMAPLGSGFGPSRWLTSCSKPHPSWNSHSSNPRYHPAAKQSWTNMDLNREIQSEYKQVMFQMNNALSVPPLTCNKNSHVFLSLHWDGYLLGLCVLRTTLPHWLFELHIIMYIVSHRWPVWAVSV